MPDRKSEAKSPAERSSTYYERMRRDGFVRVARWIPQSRQCREEFDAAVRKLEEDWTARGLISYD